jgi:hypothetical protein
LEEREVDAMHINRENADGKIGQTLVASWFMLALHIVRTVTDWTLCTLPCKEKTVIL